MDSKKELLSLIEQSLMNLVRQIKKPALWAEYCRRSSVDIDHPSIMILFTLNEGAMNFQTLVSKLGIEAPAVSRKVHELIDKGLITRIPTDDKRIHELSLSKDGQVVTSKFNLAKQSIMGEVFDDWSTTDCQELNNMLKRMHQDFNRVIQHKTKGATSE